MHLHTKIPKVVNIWASKCNIFTCARPILFLSLRHEKLKTSPDWQSITPKMSSQSNVSAATACRCRFWTHFVHIFGQKSTVGGRCDKRCWTNVCNLTDWRWAHRGFCHWGLTYKSWSSTNPGDNPQIQHLKYKIQITTQNQLEENKNLRLIIIKYKYKYRIKQISQCQTLSAFRHRAHTLYLYFPHQLIFRAGNFMPKDAWICKKTA